MSLPTLAGAEPTKARGRALDRLRPVLMVIDTPFGCVIQLGVLSMNMMDPGHRVPEIMSSPLFVFLSERNGRD